jgi:aquaporin Z
LRRALTIHYPEYLIEAAALAAFMLSALFFTALFNHPSSPFQITDPLTCRALSGLAMGLTAITIIYSPWGQRSGAHMNPALTLTFLRLRKINPHDALFYVTAQLLGGLFGIIIATLLFSQVVSHQTVNYVVTIPGPFGVTAAFFAEATLAFIMMLMVLSVTNTPRLAKFTGLFAGLLVCLFITFEAPVSGMSINPARTLGSALPSGIWISIWIYFTAPVLGMLAAAEIFLLLKRAPKACPKYFHGQRQRCIFCGHDPIP